MSFQSHFHRRSRCFEPFLCHTCGHIFPAFVQSMFRFGPSVKSLHYVPPVPPHIGLLPSYSLGSSLLWLIIPTKTLHKLCKALLWCNERTSSGLFTWCCPLCISSHVSILPIKRHRIPPSKSFVFRIIQCVLQVLDICRVPFSKFLVSLLAYSISSLSLFRNTHVLLLALLSHFRSYQYLHWLHQLLYSTIVVQNFLSA